MKWRECVGGCENLQGELRGGGGGSNTSSEWRGRWENETEMFWRRGGGIIFAFSKLGGDADFILSSFYSPPPSSPPPGPPPPLPKGPQLFWCCSKFIYLCLFMCVFVRDSNWKGRFSYLENPSPQNISLSFCTEHNCCAASSEEGE